MHFSNQEMTPCGEWFAKRTAASLLRLSMHYTSLARSVALVQAVTSTST